MTELSFLVDLLLNHKLPVATRRAVAERIKEVERYFLPSNTASKQYSASASNQAPSTQRILERNPDLFVAPPPVMPPVEQVAQTPATAAAMNSRNQAISDSLSGKIDKVSGRPRKF